jgi:hypothetical protein
MRTIGQLASKKSGLGRSGAMYATAPTSAPSTSATISSPTEVSLDIADTAADMAAQSE